MSKTSNASQKNNEVLCFNRHKRKSTTMKNDRLQNINVIISGLTSPDESKQHKKIRTKKLNIQMMWDTRMEKILIANLVRTLINLIAIYLQTCLSPFFIFLTFISTKFECVCVFVCLWREFFLCLCLRNKNDVWIYINQRKSWSIQIQTNQFDLNMLQTW